MSKSLRRGFTLAEVMISLVISGMLVAMGLPRIDSSRYRADAVARIVRTQLQAASRTAITRQHDVIVSFDTVGERIRMVYDRNNNHVVDFNEKFSWRGLDVGILFADPTITGVSGTVITSAINGSSISMMDGMPTITFHRDGSVSSDAEIYVSIAARGPKMYRAIVLTQATGREEWYRLNTTANRWLLGGG